MRLVLDHGIHEKNYCCSLNIALNWSTAIVRMVFYFPTDNLLKLLQERLRLEQYLPLLENFICHADLFRSNSQMIQWTSQLKIQWSSALGQSSFFNIGLKFFRIDNLQFELGMILFLYGAILRERAWEILPAGLQ